MPFLTRVHFHMTIFARRMGKFLATQFAFKEFLLIVCVKMRLEAPLATPCFATNFAYITLEATMPLDVKIEIPLRCVGFGAQMALVWAFLSVGSHMNFEIMPIIEGFAAQITQEFLLTRMHTHMPPYLFDTHEGLGADVTEELLSPVEFHVTPVATTRFEGLIAQITLYTSLLEDVIILYAFPAFLTLSPWYLVFHKRFNVIVIKEIR